MSRRLLPLVLFVTACSFDLPGAPSPDAAAPLDLAAPLPSHAPTPTMLGDALANAGLDPSSLPPLASLDDATRDAVMQTFTQALGLACTECHAADYAAPTRRTRIAARMWDDMTRTLRFSDGSALYCDSCHAGAATFLDRSDVTPGGALGEWMRAAYVTPLARSDGSAISCATCHGTPYVGGFLDQWGAGPPDLGGIDLIGDGGIRDAGILDAGLDAAPADLAVAGCGKLLACIDGCGSDTHCAGECKAHAPAAAKQLLQAADDCALAACVADKRCKNASDDTPDCDTCFDNASSGGATGVACVPSDDPDCGACATAWLACESD